MNNEVKYTGGIGFCGLLALIFIVLKLTGVINWSWIWVLAPLWIELIFCIVAIVIVVVILKRMDKKEWL